MAPARDKFGGIQADPVKFPHGMKAFVAELHALGFKAGLFGCIGPSWTWVYLREFQDARTFASWEIDYLKVRFVSSICSYSCRIPMVFRLP